MKCYNEDCTEYPTQIKNKCVSDAGVQMCEGFMPEKDITIANLRAELKLYKRALDLACDDLHSSLKFNYGYADEDLVNHFITKAKEDVK